MCPAEASRYRLALKLLKVSLERSDQKTTSRSDLDSDYRISLLMCIPRDMKP